MHQILKVECPYQIITIETYSEIHSNKKDAVQLKRFTKRSLTVERVRRPEISRRVTLFHHDHDIRHEPSSTQKNEAAATVDVAP